LPASGDLDYAQAPFATVLTPNELVKEYGDASVFASGLIVDGLAAFENNLWHACDTVLGYGEDLTAEHTKPEYPNKKTNKDLANYFLAREEYDAWFIKTDWVRRVKQFGDRYFEGDHRRATYCLKHVSLWKTWCDLSREYVEIDCATVEEDSETFVSADTLGAQACSGGACALEI
jgi:ribonucleoside-diphosphate reductase alpha chain